MANTNFDPQQIPEPLRNLTQNLDLEALANLKKSLDKDQVMKMVTEMMGNLKPAMSAPDFQALNQIINSLQKDQK